ncbi:hypothetical protein M23134_06512 [Microscilla marina ATCC 23134]|uniref:Uncharacterized protein n=1 Tax=Microscilla marina ATCC 23134 TaxID=313606 RepID=A1ZQP7_MICM2|nr:hypothetical protein M23134_06512 [Microscilla marina ATCC 23134]
MKKEKRTFEGKVLFPVLCWGADCLGGAIADLRCVPTHQG